MMHRILYTNNRRFELDSSCTSTCQPTPLDHHRRRNQRTVQFDVALRPQKSQGLVAGDTSTFTVQFNVALRPQKSQGLVIGDASTCTVQFNVSLC